MGATKESAKRAAEANKARYGDDYYSRIGAMGGSVSHPESRAFRKNKDLARSAGAKGGSISRRQPKVLVNRVTTEEK